MAQHTAAAGHTPRSGAPASAPDGVSPGPAGASPGGRPAGNPPGRSAAGTTGDAASTVSDAAGTTNDPAGPVSDAAGTTNDPAGPMSDAAPPAGRAVSPTGDLAGSAGYQERLVVPWWLWLLALGLAAGAAAEIGLGAPGPRTWVPYLVLLPVTAAALVWAGRLKVGVSGDELRVDDARLAARFVAQVGVLDATAKRAALGPDADPYAFVVQRPWVSRAVLVVLDDPADPTPYWIVSARRPRRLAAALLAARDRALAGTDR